METEGGREKGKMGPAPWMVDRYQPKDRAAADPFSSSQMGLIHVYTSHLLCAYCVPAPCCLCTLKLKCQMISLPLWHTAMSPGNLQLTDLSLGCFKGRPNSVSELGTVA